MINPTIIDFETEPIRPRPYYPPKPVGFSLKKPSDRKSRYFAFDHPTGGNNCTKKDAERVLKDAWKSGPLLFHNSKFDVDVAQVHMGLANASLTAVDVHDTQFLLFLLEPHAFSLALKPSAERLLDMPPEERDAVFEWLQAHQAQLKADGLLPADVRLTASNSGAWIGLAPGNIVGPYADGDILRTGKLFKLLYPQVAERGMLPAYQREQKLMPILLRNEREGMRLDVDAVEHDIPIYEEAIETAEHWVRKRLKTPGLDFNKDAQIAEALDASGVVTEWTYTKGGKHTAPRKSISKKVLKPHHYHDQRVYRALGYVGKLQTCLQTYMKPWLATGQATGGLVHSGWNQTRNDKDAGTRTGRPSGSPNFLAVAKNFEDKGDGWSHPDFIDVPHLPLVRMYLLPDSPQHIWGRRDYNQQELRILAHFEDGKLLEAYRNNPRLDVHQFVQESIKEILGLDLPRTPVKTLNFGLIYGQGVGSMAEKISRSFKEVEAMRNAQFTALPGLKNLDKALKNVGKTGDFITTWGGRQYFVEPPKVIDGRWRTFEYKLLNYLIQGSAADCTKEAIIRYDDIKPEARFLVTVYDEINISAHKKIFKREMLKLREVMMSVEFDLPMLSDAEYGPSWGDMTKLDEPLPACLR